MKMKKMKKTKKKKNIMMMMKTKKKKIHKMKLEFSRHIFGKFLKYKIS